MSAELRECPFCGGEATPACTHRSGGAFFVLCLDCGADGPMCDGDNAAAAAWNIRADDRYDLTEAGRAALGSGGVMDADEKRREWLERLRRDSMNMWGTSCYGLAAVFPEPPDTRTRWRKVWDEAATRVYWAWQCLRGRGYY